MPSFLLHVPAYHSTVVGDVDSWAVVIRLDSLPREGEQIAVPNGGLVEVANVRHHPVWEGARQKTRQLPGSRSESIQLESSVFTNWVRRPNDE